MKRKGKTKLPSLSICIYIIALLYFASFCRLLKVDNELLRKKKHYNVVEFGSNITWSKNTTDSESNIGNSTTHNRVDDSFLTTTRKRPKILQQTGDKNNKNGVFQIVHNDDDTILNILQQSGVQIGKEMAVKLPTMHNFTSLYGPKLEVLGINTCEDFRNNFSMGNKTFTERIKIATQRPVISVAGLYNTGTNLLTKLMETHCFVKGKSKYFRNHESHTMKSGMFDNVPWGKHAPVQWRDDQKYRPKHFSINRMIPWVKAEHVLPIVIVKDPYFWMKSMCKHSYEARWKHSNSSCMNLNEDKQQKVRVDFEEAPFTSKSGRFASKSGRSVEYNSLVDMWNTFYNDYINAEFPHIIVRYEDLLLYADDIIPQLCSCAGGKVVNATNGIRISKNRAKSHGKSSNLLESFMKYANDTERIKQFSAGDLVFADRMLNRDVMNTFQYSFPS